MAGWACPAWRQVAISPCSRGRPSVLAGPAVPIQDTALLHTLPPWEPLAPLETWALLQRWWASLHRLSDLQSWWPMTMQITARAEGGTTTIHAPYRRWGPCIFPTVGLALSNPRPLAPPWQCSQPPFLPDPNSHPTTSCCHPTPPASMWGGHHNPSLGLRSWVVLQTPWLSLSLLPGTPRPLCPAVATLIAQVPLILGPPGCLDRDHPMLRGTCTPVLPRTPRSLVIPILVPGYSRTLWPSWLHSLGLPRPLGHSSSVPGIPIAQVVLASSPGTLIITIPCSQGPPDPLGMALCLGLPKAPTVPCSWDPMTTGTPWTHWPL